MKDKADTAVNSTNSAQRVKRSTPKTSSLTPAQTLEILQDALRYCQLAGIDILLAAGTGNDSNDTALIMRGVVLIDGNLKVQP